MTQIYRHVILRATSEESKGCPYKGAAEQKARSTYEYLIDLTDDPDVLAPLRFLREREVVHFQRFGECLDIVNDYLGENKTFVMPENCLSKMKNNECRKCMD